MEDRLEKAPASEQNSSRQSTASGDTEQPPGLGPTPKRRGPPGLVGTPFGW